mgnify:CR=1 FL=1
MGVSYPQTYDWQESTPSASNATATHAAETNIRHVIDFIAIQGDSAGKTWTITTGSRIIFVGDIGDESLTLGTAFLGDIGQNIAVALNTTGQVTIAGHSQRMK